MKLPSTVNSCPASAFVSMEDCVAAGLSVGGTLHNGKLVLGSWRHTPFGCFIGYTTDNAIHFSSNQFSINDGRYEPVCKVEP
jgi:hypothetical protein